jgi:hypothetical protein
MESHHLLSISLIAINCSVSIGTVPDKDFSISGKMAKRTKGETGIIGRNTKEKKPVSVMASLFAGCSMLFKNELTGRTTTGVMLPIIEEAGMPLQPLLLSAVLTTDS